MAQYHQQHEMKQTMTETPYVTAPPQMGYPVMMKDSPQTVQTQQSKGSVGFLRGWYHIIYIYLVGLFILFFGIIDFFGYIFAVWLQCAAAAFWIVSSRESSHYTHTHSFYGSLYALIMFSLYLVLSVVDISYFCCEALLLFWLLYCNYIIILLYRIKS
ncbi:uncharacterized protein LOC17899453 isoform X1 [Capsella rubella]|uniref:uncharacterized protein LOC17899453 isoform X1 n=1 Tax=Capsella rubella TaxID=81985 RepID=UPI000CD4DA2A|nr:uncharacterized protein LOC17899453 isoform X1 [Capsella rubella]